MLNMFIHVGLQNELTDTKHKIDYSCKKPHCEYCYQMKRLELLKQPKPEPVLKPVGIRKYRYPKPRSINQPHYKWTEEDIALLIKLIDVPISELVIKGVFGEHTHSAIGTRKTILRKQYGLKPKYRNMRIYHQ